MEVDHAPTSTKTGKDKGSDKKRFEVKKVSDRRRGGTSNDLTEHSVECGISMGVGYAVIRPV